MLKEYVYFKNPETTIVAKPKEKNVDRIKMALLRAKELKPQLSENDTLAKYESEIFKIPLKFIKIDGQWLIMDK